MKRGRVEVLVLVGAVVLSLAAGVIGAALSGEATGEWYRQLRRPDYAPPDWVFGPVWTVLYILMGIAAWLVWRRGHEAARPALILFAVQLVLNAMWPGLFFGLRSPGLALLGIVLLWLAVLATTGLFFRHSSLGGVLMLPYLAWVSFAAILNAAIWRMNP